MKIVINHSASCLLRRPGRRSGVRVRQARGNTQTLARYSAKGRQGS